MVSDGWFSIGLSLFKGAANQKFKPIKTCGWREISKGNFISFINKTP